MPESRNSWRTMKNLISSIVLIMLLLASCQPASVADDNPEECDPGIEITAVSACNRDYYPSVKALFDNAEKTIHIIMYDMKYYDYDPQTEEMLLFNALVNAAGRGVSVYVVLEQSDWNSDVNADNELSGGILSSYGVDVRYDARTVTTHCKMMVIDSVKTLVGSTNWSKSAVSSNNEANVIMTGSEISLEFLDYFNTLWQNSFEKE